MSDINAKNVGSVVNNPTAPVNITNIFNDGDTPSLPSNIPSPKGFIGREAELAALLQAKTDGKTSFVLHGIGGVGKTDLALKFIEGFKADYATHIRVDMFGLSEKPTSVNDAKLEVIRMFKPDVPANLDDKDINNLYISLLNQHKTILFFDNAKDREQVEPLNVASALVVITSRTNLYVAGCFSLPVEQMSPPDARNLLYSVADETRFDGQADALAYLAGYLPMALLPLGGMLAEYITLEAVDLVEKYKERKERLQLADPNRENLSVEASFDLSYESLSDELQVCWRKLAVFPADFDLEAMQAVWQIEDGKAIRHELVKKHLLEFNSKTKRFHLHDLARDYTSEKLSDEATILTRRNHWFYFGKLLSSFQHSIESIAKFDIEQPNIKQGFASLIKEIELGDDFAFYIVPYVSRASYYLSLRSDFSEHLNWLETALKITQKFGNEQNEGYRHESYLLLSLGVLYKSHDMLDKAWKCYFDALTLARNCGDRNFEAQCLGNIATINRLRNDFDSADTFHKIAIQIFTELKDKTGLSKEYINLGFVLVKQKKYSEAVRFFKLSKKILKNLTDLYSTQTKANLYESWGGLFLNVCKYKQAIRYFNIALRISENIEDQPLTARLLANLGCAYKSLDEKDKAKIYFQKSIVILERIRSPLVEKVKSNLANLDI